MYLSSSLLKFQSWVSRCSPAIIITAIYLIIGTLWILLSDIVIMQIANNNNHLLAQLQNQNGLAFVMLSGLLFFLVSHELYNRLRKSNKQKYSLEQKTDALNAVIRGGMIDYDVELKKAEINDKMKFFFPSISNTVSDFFSLFLKRIHKNDRERVRNEYDAAMLSPRELWTTEYKLLGSNNNYYTVMSSLFLIRNKQGIIHRLVGEIQDISQLRNLQEDLYMQRLKHKQTLASAIIKAQENERNRWAQELHDNISQILTVINLYLSNAKVKIDNNATMINEVKKMVNEVQQEIRLLSATMKPPAFSLMTLEQTLDRLISNINRIKKLGFRLTAAGLDETRLSDEQKLMIYRVVQEQLNNIIKYAEATRVTINLYSEDDLVHIELNDDGKGFDNSKLKTGLGFRNIQSRLMTYNGHMKLESAPGKGCTLAATFHI